MTPNRGEVWLFDLGMAEKVRPALVVSVGYGDVDRALIIHPPASHQPSRFPIRDCRQCPVLEGWRIPSPERGDVSERKRAIRKLGTLKSDQFNSVFAGLLRWLGDARV
jgi:mRNA interferase MazF